MRIHRIAFALSFLGLGLTGQARAALIYSASVEKAARQADCIILVRRTEGRKSPTFEVLRVLKGAVPDLRIQVPNFRKVEALGNLAGEQPPRKMLLFLDRVDAYGRRGSSSGGGHYQLVERNGFPAHSCVKHLKAVKGPGGERLEMLGYHQIMNPGEPFLTEEPEEEAQALRNLLAGSLGPCPQDLIDAWALSDVPSPADLVPEAIQAWIRDLGSPRWRNREAAQEKLLWLGPAVLELIDPFVDLYAEEQKGHPPESLLQECLARLQGNDRRLRETAFKALLILAEDQGPDRPVETWIELHLGEAIRLNPALPIRDLILQNLARPKYYTNKELCAGLVLASRDRAYIRKAYEALRPNLVHHDEDPDWDSSVPTAAHWAMVSMGAEVVPLLRADLQQAAPNTPERDALRDVLAEMGDPTVIPLLLKDLPNAAREHGYDIVRSLAGFLDAPTLPAATRERIREALLAQLTRERMQEGLHPFLAARRKYDMAEILLRFKEPSAVEALLDLLGDMEARDIALQALQKLSGKDWSMGSMTYPEPPEQAARWMARQEEIRAWWKVEQVRQGSPWRR